MFFVTKSNQLYFNSMSIYLYSIIGASHGYHPLVVHILVIISRLFSSLIYFTCHTDNKGSNIYIPIAGRVDFSRSYCQGQPQLNTTQLQLKLRLRLALFPPFPATHHPPMTRLRPDYS